MTTYPIVNVMIMKAACSVDGHCQNVQTNPKKCKALEKLDIEESRVHIYASAQILVKCRKDKAIMVRVNRSASLIPQPPCSYSVNFTNSNVLAEIKMVPTYTKSILLTQDHINQAFTLHNSTDWHTQVDDIVEDIFAVIYW